MILDKFRPDHYYSSLDKIDFSNFVHYETIIFDYDNTLTAWSGEIPYKIAQKLNTLSKKFRLFVFSNGKQKRIEKSCANLPVKAYGNCHKPCTKSAVQTIISEKINPEKTLFIGDNLITDIYFANNLNLTTILLDPLRKKEFFLTKFWRICEKAIKPFLKLKKDEN